MTGFIIGVIGSWSENLKDQVVGYYDSWETASTEAKKLYYKTIKYEKFRKVFIVELETNKNYKVSDLIVPWYRKFTHYIVDNNGIVSQNILK